MTLKAALLITVLTALTLLPRAGADDNPLVGVSESESPRAVEQETHELVQRGPEIPVENSATNETAESVPAPKKARLAGSTLSSSYNFGMIRHRNNELMKKFSKGASIKCEFEGRKSSAPFYFDDKLRLDRKKSTQLGTLEGEFDRRATSERKFLNEVFLRSKASMPSADQSEIKFNGKEVMGMSGCTPVLLSEDDGDTYPIYTKPGKRFEGMVYVKCQDLQLPGAFLSSAKTESPKALKDVSPKRNPFFDLGYMMIKANCSADK